MPEVSVIIPWRNRPELSSALARNSPIFKRHAAEVLVVNAGGDCDALKNLLRDLRELKLRVIYLPDASFNRSLCLNVGIWASRADYVFLTDADIVLATDFFAEAIPWLQRGPNFVTPKRIVESNASPDVGSVYLAEQITTTEYITVDGRRAVIRARVSPKGVRPGDGILLLRRADLLKVGGLNSKLVGWGFEDTDLQIRLQFKLGLTRVEVGRVVHLTHKSHRDGKAWTRNMLACRRNYNETRYEGSLDGDAMGWQDTLVELSLDDVAAGR